MKINSIIIFCFLFSVLCFTGCASGGRRFYSDNIRPVKDVAIVYAGGNCRVDSITETGKPKKDLEGAGILLGEILPGNYVFNTRFVNMGTYSNEFGQAVDLPLNAKPGHVYFIYAKSANSSWQPIIIDILKDEDYSKIDDAEFSGDVLKNAVAKYINGEREIIQETKFTSQGRAMSIWR